MSFARELISIISRENPRCWAHNRRYIITKIEEEIQEYNKSIRRGQFPQANTVQCPNPECGKIFDKVEDFKFHDQRNRKIRIVVEAMVKIILTIFIRRKCPVCGKKFTVYPSFAIPHKRYASPYILQLCENYLNREKISYDNAARDGNNRIGYDNEKGDSLLPGTTVRRWICYFGKMENVLRTAIDMILQKNPQTDIHRKIPQIPSRKYKKNEMKSILETAARILLVRAEYVRFFSAPFFPRFAVSPKL